MPKTQTKPNSKLLPESKIREAILHPELEVRLTALEYFSRSFSEDPSIMPLVIQAVEEYGRDTAFRMLRNADSLVQTSPTIKWLVNELRRDYDAKDISHENYHFSIALILLDADPDLLVPQHREIAALMPEMFQDAFDERLKFHFWSWDQCWAALLELGRATMSVDTITRDDDNKARRIVKALASHGEDQHALVLNLLRRQYKREVRPLMEWMEAWVVELAGLMRIEKAIPLLLKKLDEGYDAVVDQLGKALVRIGTDSVIQAVNRVWPSATVDSKYSLCDPLEHIHGEVAAERSLAFLRRENDEDIQLCLGRCVLGHFDERGIEPVRHLVLVDEDEIDIEQLELRYSLVAAATVMGKTFPEYFAWHQVAIDDNYGWHAYQPARIFESLQGIFEDIGGPEITSNIRQSESQSSIITN